jgi:hypothetical protein
LVDGIKNRKAKEFIYDSKTICRIVRTDDELIGDFFEKFHFSLVVARLAGTLVDGIKNRKAKEIYL